jgi:hypothetical protein
MPLIVSRLIWYGSRNLVSRIRNVDVDVGKRKNVFMTQTFYWCWCFLFSFGWTRESNERDKLFQLSSQSRLQISHSFFTLLFLMTGMSGSHITSLNYIKVSSLCYVVVPQKSSTERNLANIINTTQLRESFEDVKSNKVFYRRPFRQYSLYRPRSYDICRRSSGRWERERFLSCCCFNEKVVYSILCLVFVSGQLWGFPCESNEDSETDDNLSFTVIIVRENESDFVIIYSLLQFLGDPSLTFVVIHAVFSSCYLPALRLPDWAWNSVHNESVEYDRQTQLSNQLIWKRLFIFASKRDEERGRKWRESSVKQDDFQTENDTVMNDLGTQLSSSSSCHVRDTCMQNANNDILGHQSWNQHIKTKHQYQISISRYEGSRKCVSVEKWEENK